jgi:hypothetical protein
MQDIDRCKSLIKEIRHRQMSISKTLPKCKTSIKYKKKHQNMLCFDKMLNINKM